MKKTLMTLLMVLLCAMLIISCDGNAESPVIHKVTFDFDNGSSAVVKEVKDGEKAAEPTNPTKTGYSFQGWYDGDTKFEFTTAITKDYTLKAKWETQTCTVSFNVNGGTGTYENQTINYGEKVDASKVTNPTRTEASFLGWYNGSTKVDLANDTVTDNLDLTAKWGFTVSFNSDEGSSVQPQTVEENGTATKPDDPTKTGYTFSGWYEGDNEFVFTTPITKATTLKAKWNIATYTVTFNSDGGTPTNYDSKSVNYNGTIATAPTEPTKTGYTFGGWYNGNDKFEFGTTTVTGNIELEAKWNAVYTVTFNVEGSTTTISPKTTGTDGKVEAPTDKPTKSGWVFDHWAEEANGTTAFDFANTVISADTTLYAVFRDYYIVGDTGPAGGIIFYVADSEQTSMYFDSTGTKHELKWRYLEAAPANLTGTYTNGSYTGKLGTGTGIGYGWINAQIYEANTISNYPGAEACANYGNNTPSYDDWFLPSRDELDLMLNKSGIIGGLEDGNYLSSSEYGADKWYYGGIGGAAAPGYFNNNRCISGTYVRPIRAFNSTSSSASSTTYHTVSFNTDGGTWSYILGAVADGAKIDEPTKKPTKNGQIFDHWATEANGATAFDFDTTINTETTLYAVFRDYRAGDIASFGIYPTNYAIASLKGEDVTWKVLSVDTTNSRMLVVSENVLETRNDTNFTSYSGSDIQKYLNGDFISTYGLGDVNMCKVDVTSNIEQTTISTTEDDKVFLLSKTEAENTSYFANAATRVANYNGAWQWTLRSVDSYFSCPYAVSTDGSISGFSRGALRPAMWVNL